MSTRKILVVGGAGYIGSHMVDQLLTNGYEPIVLDNLSTGHADAVGQAQLIIGDIADNALLDNLFSKHQFLAVMHFASFIQVGESVTNPGKYYQNNFSHTITLLQSMLRWHVKKIIFSSTAAVYGTPTQTLINENHLLNPINPYGHSKRMVEQVLEDFSNAYGMRFAILRYFNAAGRKRNSNLRECHEPETHLIPLILDVAAGKRKNIQIFGNDYPTPDGTCIRDYIHVLDLCSAHLLALEKIISQDKSFTYNLGTSHGYSVKQVIETASKITKRDISIIHSPRRNGDPAILVADAHNAKKFLGWTHYHSDIETIITDAWEGY